MKKNSQRKPKPRMPVGHAPSAAAAHASGTAPAAQEREERKVGIATGTPADTFDETSERKHDKWIAIYISVLAVLIAIAATFGNDAMKNAQQSALQANDSYGFYQAKLIRESLLRANTDQFDFKGLETPNLPDAARKFLDTKKADYDKEITRLNFNRKNGKKELLAKAEDCDNIRSVALAQHPYFDYAGAMLQIAIVLASASIITGARLLLGASGMVGVLGVVFFLNGFLIGHAPALVHGAPEQKSDKFEALQKSLTYMHRWEAEKIARCPVE
jgi:Domain of unknown function (DUF4337)